MYHYILKELGKVFYTKAYFNIFFDKEVILVINKTECNSQNKTLKKHLDSSKIETIKNLESLKRLKVVGNVRSFSTFYNRNKEVKPTLILKEPNSLENSLEKILINGLIFHKSKDEF